MSIIICKHSTYQRTPSGKSWQVKPYKEKWQEIKELIFFTNFQRPDPFMKALGGTERIYKTTTHLGYVAKRVVCVSPDRQDKSERLFFIFRDEEDLKENGTIEIKAFWDKQKEHNN